MEDLRETFLLILNDLGNEGFGLSQFWIGLFHLIHDFRGSPIEERTIDPEYLSMTHRPSHDSAQHVSPALVRGKNSVADQKGRRPAVVSNDSDGGIGSRILSIGNRTDGFNLFKEGVEKI